ncbi:MAG: hypothetical protein NT067_04430 [Candidatus Diapherotrites archaeon]|nr:hypothetical protein [Candidatus Diapherotrites archaeon]
MACFAVPLGSAIIVHIVRKLKFKENGSLRLLELILGGGAAMLVIDHAWNNELFFSGNLAMDLLLGAAMTLGAVLFWALAVSFGAAKAPEKDILNS